jgi:hypothetical protein
VAKDHEPCVLPCSSSFSAPTHPCESLLSNSIPTTDARDWRERERERKKAHRRVVVWERGPVPEILDQHAPVLAFQCEILHAERPLAPPRVVRGEAMLAEHRRRPQRHVPLRHQLHLIINRELPPAPRVVPPQPLLPQKRPVQRRLNLIQSEILRRRPNLAPQRHSLITPHRTLHQNRIVLYLITRNPAKTDNVRKKYKEN